MGIEAAPSVKYLIIREIAQRDNNMLNITWLCEIACVSRSGYYNWLASEPTRISREEQDRKDFELILTAYNFRGFAKGARGIYMRLLHQTPSVVINIKKIRRLMRRYGLKCPIRKVNPYRRMAKAMETSYVAPNLLNREFRQHGPRKVLLTDITYSINAPCAPSCTRLHPVGAFFLTRVFALQFSSIFRYLSVPAKNCINPETP